MPRTNPRYANVAPAVQSVWADAGFDRPTTGIVPLAELVSSYPIWVSEVENLTFDRAALTLTKATGQTPEIGLAGSEALSGFFYAYQYRDSFVGCILVEKRDPIVRRRFSVAHELGHYRLHFLTHLAQLGSVQLDLGLMIADAMIYDGQEDGSDGVPLQVGHTQPVMQLELTPHLAMNDEDEYQANQFAGELLVPEESLAARIASLQPKSGQPRGYLASRLAGEYLVSKETMSIRLSALGY